MAEEMGDKHDGEGKMSVTNGPKTCACSVGTSQDKKVCRFAVTSNGYIPLSV